MKTAVKVHPVAEMFAMIDGGDYEEFRDSISTFGLIESIKYDHTGTVLVDGRNRLRACEELGIEPRSELLPEGTDLVAYIVGANIHRRHLNAGQRAMLALNLLPDIEAQADPGGRPKKHEADRPHVSDDQQPEERDEKKRAPQARDKAAALTGSSGKAVARAKRVKEKAPDLAEAVVKGDLALDAAEKQLKRRLAVEAEAEAREATIDSTTADASDKNWSLLHGDFRERLTEIEPGSVDLIITDPPYPEEFMHLWDHLSQVAASILKPQGILVALTGQIYLPEVMARLGTHLSYGWTYCQPLPGQQSRIMGRHVLQSWKPWVAYSNGAWPSGRIDWHPDMLDPSYRAKDRYRWEQDPDPVKLIIDALSDEGGLVLDPFTGTGSYGVAALATGRLFLGVEMDGDRFATAAKRLKGVQS